MNTNSSDRSPFGPNMMEWSHIFFIPCLLFCICFNNICTLMHHLETQCLILLTDMFIAFFTWSLFKSLLASTSVPLAVFERFGYIQNSYKYPLSSGSWSWCWNILNALQPLNFIFQTFEHTCPAMFGSHVHFLHAHIEMLWQFTFVPTNSLRWRNDIYLLQSYDITVAWTIYIFHEFHLQLERPLVYSSADLC